MQNFWRMWKYPRLAAWFVITTMLVVLVRLPFAMASPVPHYIDFNPGIVIVPLAAVFWGPAGVLGCLAGTLLGDGLFGMWSEFTIFRAIGVVCFAASAQRLWQTDGLRKKHASQHSADVSSTFHFICISIPGCFLASTWAGWGSEFLGLYPFPYFASIVLLNNLLYVVLLGAVCYPLFVRKFITDENTWDAIMGAEATASPLSAKATVCLWGGAIGAYVAGCFAAWLFYQTTPFKYYILGTTAGLGLLVIITPFMLLQIAALFSASGRGT